MREQPGETADIGSGKIPADIPSEFDPDNDEFPEERHTPSLLEDVVHLFEDTKTYLEAETAFQKSRGGYVANRLKSAVAYGAAAFGVFHLALIALTVGLVIALSPLVGPWLATLIVGGLLIVVGLVLLRGLKSKIDDIRSAFDREEP
ncbi:hypothetical protein MTsN3n11_25890 [Qipengyuania sp. MTN3-11]